MMTITKERNLTTFINVFNVDPEKQQQLVNLLIQATESSVRHVPGFRRKSENPAQRCCVFADSLWVCLTEL